MSAGASNSLVAANVRAKRTQLGLSQEALGTRAGLHRTYIGAIERAEENITLSTLDKLAKALRVEPADLLRRHLKS